jgi:uncharacterized protein YbaR (Trm112 family)
LFPEETVEWTPSQLKALYANVYQRRRVCPSCGGPLTLTPSRESDAVGVVKCPSCDARHLVARSNDPLRATFRPYTAEETRTILAAERRGLTPTCPVDDTPMEVHLQRSLARTSNAQVWCRRCGGTTDYVRPHG